MYQYWIRKRGWTCEVVDSVEGEIVGLRSITMKVCGRFAYGYCKAERGVHRLVRISPFDSEKRRHTTFAAVEVLPEATENEVTINPDLLVITTCRSSGPGGQHVNKTDSAVRVSYEGIVVACQKERSQRSNKETCMALLRAKLMERAQQQRDMDVRKITDQQKSTAWGNHRRSYIFEPYSLVSDHMTNLKIGNIQAVMNGDLDPFVLAYLKQHPSV